MPSSLEDSGSASTGGSATNLTRAPSTVIRRLAIAFGHFWWEFLVGETPGLLVGAVAAIGIVALLVHNSSWRVVTVGALPVLILALLTISAVRAGRSK